MKIVVITGCTRGLGKGFFDLFKDTDHHIVGISRRVTTQTAKNVTTAQLDLATSFDPATAIPWKDLPKTNEVLFINNAAVIEPIKPVRELDRRTFERIFAINYTAGALIAQYLVQQFASVHIAHIGTGASTHPISHWGLYCSSKAAIDMLFRVFEQEENIKLDIVDPGVMDTDMQGAIRKASFPQKDHFTDLQEQSKLKNPSEAARHICEEYKLL